MGIVASSGKCHHSHYEVFFLLNHKKRSLFNKLVVFQSDRAMS
ncbi:MAG: hypothetical protein ACFCU5_00840 [Pleurocapsa sp.]